MNQTPTPLHPVATTQAGELPELPATFAQVARFDGTMCDAYTPNQMRAYALAAIEMQASHSAAADAVPVAVVYPPDGTVSPFTVINLGAGKVKIGDSIHDARLPALWFGKDGTGMGDEEVMNRAAKDGETLAVVTFANVEGLDVLLEVVERIRRISFPDAARPSPATAPASETITISTPADRRVFINEKEAAALNRFAETCEDSEGYDVPKPMMQRLACIGAIRRVTGNIYQFTDFGMWLMEPPTITATEPQ